MDAEMDSVSTRGALESTLNNVRDKLNDRTKDIVKALVEADVQFTPLTALALGMVFSALGKESGLDREGQLAIVDIFFDNSKMLVSATPIVQVVPQILKGH